MRELKFTRLVEEFKRASRMIQGESLTQEQYDYLTQLFKSIEKNVMRPAKPKGRPFWDDDLKKGSSNES